MYVTIHFFKNYTFPDHDTRKECVLLVMHGGETDNKMFLFDILHLMGHLNFGHFKSSVLV